MEYSCLATAEKYDFNLQKWELLSDMSIPRRALSAVSLPNGIYAIGGLKEKQYLDSVERYDIETEKWVSVTSMNEARCTLSAVTSND